MVAMGWPAAAGSMTSVQDPCLLAFDPFGACENYLGIEYYHGPLDGELRMLKLVSQRARGEADIDFAINNAALIAVETRAAALRAQMSLECLNLV